MSNYTFDLRLRSFVILGPGNLKIPIATSLVFPVELARIFPSTTGKSREVVIAKNTSGFLLCKISLRKTSHL